MSTLSITSRINEGIIIDISSCSSFNDAYEQLSGVLKVSSQFWNGFKVTVNFGALEMTKAEVLEIKKFLKSVGLIPESFETSNQRTQLAIEASRDFDWTKVEENEPIQNIASNKIVNQDLVNENVLELQSVTVDTEFVPKSNSVANKAKRVKKNKNTSEEQIEFLNSSMNSMQPVLYLKQTLRSGQIITHDGHLVVIGDVNPGAEVIASGDITVWGNLKGIVHAGCKGNYDSQIRALLLDPIQIRIADLIARSPDKVIENSSSSGGSVVDKLFSKQASPVGSLAIKIKPNTFAETAKVVDGKIKILKSNFDIN